MRLLALTLAALGLLSIPAYANHAEGHVAVSTVTVKVNGLVCDFCARAVEKVFYQQEGVEGVVVSLDDHAVRIEMGESVDMTDEIITKLITDAGYNVVEIIRE